jgi:hypothetical protein
MTVMGGADGVHQPVPHARPPPAHKPVVAGRARPIALGQIAPRRARAQHPEDAVEHPPVINPRHSARLVRQQRLDHPPLEIRQIVSAHRNAPSSGTLNQIDTENGIPFMGSRPNPEKIEKILDLGESTLMGVQSLFRSELNF